MSSLEKFNRENVLIRVRKIVHDIFDLKNNIEDSTLFSTFDSMEELRRLELVVTIETHFPVPQCPEEQWNKFDSINSIVDWLMENINEELEISSDEYNSYLEELENEESSSSEIEDDESM